MDGTGRRPGHFPLLSRSWSEIPFFLLPIYSDKRYAAHHVAAQAQSRHLVGFVSLDQYPHVLRVPGDGHELPRQEVVRTDLHHRYPKSIVGPRKVKRLILDLEAQLSFELVAPVAAFMTG